MKLPSLEEVMFSLKCYAGTISALCLLGIMPAVHSFEMLALSLFPVAFVTGIFLARPTTASKAMAKRRDDPLADDALKDLRVGTDIAELQRARRHLPVADAAIQPVLRGQAARERAVVALVGIRRTFFPDAQAYRPLMAVQEG